MTTPTRAGFLPAFATLAFALACTRTPGRVVPYQGEMQNVHEHGANSLRIVTADDPAIRKYVATQGEPDFLLVTGPHDVELVYYQASRVVHFHRAPDATRAGELSPLPLELVNVLPVDLRAGTPGSIQKELPPQAGCWRVGVEDMQCRTCCRSSIACSSECRPR